MWLGGGAVYMPQVGETCALPPSLLWMPSPLLLFPVMSFCMKEEIGCWGHGFLFVIPFVAINKNEVPVLVRTDTSRLQLEAASFLVLSGATEVLQYPCIKRAFKHKGIVSCI